MLVSNPEAPSAAASFRDPGGRLYRLDGRIFRTLNREGAAAIEAAMATKAFAAFAAQHRIVATSPPGAAGALPIASPEGTEAVVEHEPIPFPSYPYEWPPEMLHAAAELTIELAAAFLKEGFGLKDATPYNVLFRGPDPLFVDVLSFERREPRDPAWLAYAQFVRTFLLPLLVNSRFGTPLSQTFLSRRDGLEPEEVYRLAGPLRRLSPLFLSLVSLPVWLGARRNPDDATIYRQKLLANPEQARFVLSSLLRGARRKLAKLALRPGKSSNWSGYMDGGNNYSAEQFDGKELFVRQFLATHAPRRVLDVGCNTGRFSAMAAEAGAEVVAIDTDPVVAGRVWRMACSRRLNILPLVVDLTRPTPAAGWRNQECPSFLERASGRFDAVFFLAVIHHMLVTERVPLREIVSLAAQLTSRYAIIEFVAPEDSMFRRLTRGREDLHRDLNRPTFEAECRREFRIAATAHLPGASRSLYLLERL